MRIALMGAMPEEIDPLLDRIEDVAMTEYGENRYYQGHYRGREVVVAYSKIGKVFAALTATVLIEKFRCDTLLFSGVAGAISEELHIGDLIMAESLCQHDLDLTAFGHPYGYVPEGKLFVPTDERLRALARKVAAQRGLELKEGIIATGDQFVADPERKAWIGRTFGAAALEMEGASVAVVCDSLRVPFFVLRAISDSADMDAGFDFDAFLVKSAKVSAEFILEMVARLPEAQR